MQNEEFDFFGEQDYSMMFYANRLKSFKDWPFNEDCNCTPEKMAEAGFYHCPTQHEPDLARCFACYKELEGWQPEDDPWKEHKSHASSCPMVKYEKPEDELTVLEFLDIAKEKEINRVKKLSARKQANLLKMKAKLVEELKAVAKKGS